MGEEPADTRTRGGKAMLGLSGGRGAEARGRDDRGSPFASAGHSAPPVALGLRAACAFVTLLSGVGWIPPVQKAGLNDIRRGPDP
eukprot:scaffold143844_cov105-Phaeocystis_antarctica.AAC.1